MKKEPVFYLEHIADCSERIIQYTRGLTQADFMQNTLVQDAVIRNLEIIGEATKQLDEDFRSNYSEIEWRKIAGMRDKLIHDYIGVDLWAVHKVVTDVIPEFNKEIIQIIERERAGK